MHTAVAISTYVPAGSPPELSLRLTRALESLQATGYTGGLYVVDDGSTCPEHLQMLHELTRRVRVIRRKVNGGVARTKNTCLQAIGRREFDIGFLVDDDIEFRSGWLEAYVTAHQQTGIQHFSWSWDHDPTGSTAKWTCEHHGFEIVQCARLNGVLLSFTPTVLREVGGFRVMPARWGHEHVNWSARIRLAGLTPFWADVVDSNRYIGINQYGATSALSVAEKLAAAEQNKPISEKLKPIYRALVE